jgi:hypothetical protein
MSLLQTPRTSWGIRILSLLAALLVAGLIAHLVLTFGWYASGLALDKEEERRRREAPIPLNFGEPGARDPNVPDPNAPDARRPD